MTYRALSRLLPLIVIVVLGCQTAPGLAPGETRSAVPGGLDPAAYPIIDELCQGMIDGGHTPGVALLIGRGDQILKRQVYGNRMNEPWVEPMTYDTLFDLASLTKATCTASAVMLLVQDGKIALDASVAKYVPEFDREGKRQITILHLLTHTSGLPAYTSAAYLEENYGPRPNPDALIKRISELDNKYETGKGYVYSCLNYLTLARVAQNVLGHNMDPFLRERMWKPLGMNNTTFYPSATQLPRTAPTIYSEKEGFRRGMVHDPLAYYSVCESYAPGNAGGFTTVDDMSKYARMILNGGSLGGVTIFRPDIWEKITTDQVPEGVDADRSCGWGVWSEGSYATPLNQTPETCCLGHTGYTGTILWMDKLSKAYVIVFTNCVYPVDKKENKDAVIAARRKVIKTVIDHLDLYRDVRQQPAGN